MTKEESAKIVDKVKIYRQNFTITNSVYHEWFKILSAYEYVDVDEKLDNYFQDLDNEGKYPNPYYLVKYLKTQKEKNSTTSYKVICPNCGKPVDLEDLDGKHYNRCLSTTYIIRMKKKYFNKETDIEEINALSEDVFWDKYYKFLEIISQIEGFDITKIVQEPSREDISNRINQMTLKI